MCVLCAWYNGRPRQPVTTARFLGKAGTLVPSGTTLQQHAAGQHSEQHHGFQQSVSVSQQLAAGQYGHRVHCTIAATQTTNWLRTPCLSQTTKHVTRFEMFDSTLTTQTPPQQSCPTISQNCKATSISDRVNKSLSSKHMRLATLILAATCTGSLLAR